MNNIVSVFRRSGRRNGVRFAVASLILFAVAVAPGRAQLKLDVRAPAVVSYDLPSRTYAPDSVTIGLVLVNDTPDTLHAIHADLFVQKRLRFEDGNSRHTLAPGASLSPGDTLAIDLPLRIVRDNPQLGQQFSYPQQLMWTAGWEQGRARAPHESEGHAIAVKDRDCPDGMTADLANHVFLPDTIRLLPGETGASETVCEVDGMICSLDGRPYLLKGVHLDVQQNISIFGAGVSVERLLPGTPMEEVTLAGTDTLRTRYRLRIPYGMANDHLTLTQYANVYHADGCTQYATAVGGAYQALWLRHEPGSRLKIAGGIAGNSHGGLYGTLAIQSWCGSQPEGVDSAEVTIRENGEIIPLEMFTPQRYSPDHLPVHAVLAIDISHSMRAPETRARILETVRAWQEILDPRRDSLSVFTLSDSARMVPASHLQAGVSDSLLFAMPARSGAGLFPQLRDVTAYATARQPGTSVLMVLMTDGWFPHAEVFLDTLFAVMKETGLSWRAYTPSATINRDAIPGRYPPESFSSDYAFMKRSGGERYAQGALLYPIPCWSGRLRNREITVRDWCGKDTVLQHAYELAMHPGPVPFHAEARDTTVLGGGPFDLPVRYVDADRLWNDHAEFLIEFDSTLLRLQSVSIPRLAHTVLHRTWDTPGRAHIISGVDTDRGTGEVGSLSFATSAVTDTVRTPVVITAWDRANCIPTDSSHVTMVTLLPATTTADLTPAHAALRIDGCYPQPAQDLLHVELRGRQDRRCDLRIVDMLGRIRHRMTIEGGSGRHEIHATIGLPAHLPSGAYLLELQQDGSRTARIFQVSRPR